MPNNAIWGHIMVLPTKDLEITLGRDSKTVVDHIQPSLHDSKETVALLTLRKTLELLNKLEDGT